VAKIEIFRELEVWQVAMEAVMQCYELTATYPRIEVYGLSRETRRSVISVPCNIAEGHNRHANNVYLNHVNIALGSVAELETQLEIAVRLGYVSRERTSTLESQLSRIGQMLRRLQQSLEARKGAGLILVVSLLLGITSLLL
jgi:four helix bundle protein